MDFHSQGNEVLETGAQPCPQKWLHRPRACGADSGTPGRPIHSGLCGVNLDLNLVHRSSHRRPFFQVPRESWTSWVFSSPRAQLDCSADMPRAAVWRACAVKTAASGGSPETQERKQC